MTINYSRSRVLIQERLLVAQKLMENDYTAIQHVCKIIRQGELNISDALWETAIILKRSIGRIIHR